MPGTDHSEPHTATPGTGNRRRRLAIRAGIGASSVLLLFVLVVFVLPTPLAHYVIASQLENLGIQHDGIDTVDIDLWNSEVRAGPVTFRAGQAQEGQIGETGFDYSFGELFKGHAFVRTFYLRGVDVYVSRLSDGAIAINGINLQDLAGSGGADSKGPATQATPAEEKEGGSGFGFGGERFEFADSRLVFEDVSGGTLTMDLDRLTLDRLRSWTPDEPTTFEMKGQLNEIDLALDGTIVPLGDPLIATLNTRLQGITLNRVARFIGPTGLARQDGTVDTEVHYDYSFYKDGRIEGTIDGTYHFNGFDILTETGENLTLDAAILKVDLRQELQLDGSATASGQAQFTGQRLNFTNAASDALEVGTIGFAIESLDLRKGTEPRRRIFEPVAAASPMAEITPSIVELMIGWAREVGRNVLDYRVSIEGEPNLTLKDGRLHVADRDGMAGQGMHFNEATVHLGGFVGESFDAGLSVNSALEMLVSGLRLAKDDGTAEASLAEFGIDSRTIDFNVTRQDTALAFDLAVKLKDLSAKDDQGAELELRGLSLATDGFRIAETAASEEASGPLTLGLDGLSVRLAGETGDLDLRGETLALNLTPLTLTGKQGEAGQLSGSLELTGLAVERGGEAPLTFSLAQTRSELQDIRVAPLNAQATIEGSLTTALSEVALTAGQGTEAFTFSLETLENGVKDLGAGGFDSPAPDVTLANETRLSGLSARLPLPGGEAAEATIASLQASLSELAFSEGAVRAKGAVEVSAIAARTESETPQSLDLASLSLTGLDGDSARGAAAERLALGQLTAKLALPLPGMSGSKTGNAAADTETTTAEAQQEPGPENTAPPQFDKQFKLGSVTLAPGSTVDITDRGVEPPLQASVMVERLEAGPIDTTAPETRSDLALALSVNKASKVHLDGWAAPLKAKPDFELTADVEGVRLPILSSYAAKVTGVNIESGELFAKVDANAADGDLGGGIDLKINDLFVTPLDEEQAEKLKADIGLPVGFAVSILKDSEGVIAFGLPLGGTVAEPEVDYSEAIDKAVSGAMASLFPTSWFGPDGNTFEMQPAPFVAGTAELTEEGKAVADQMGSLFASKPGISIRACGRAGRADLVALRGGPLEQPGEMPGDRVMPAGTPPAETSAAPSNEDATQAAKDAASALAAPPDKTIAPDTATEIAAPSDEEVQALLGLATERGAAVRKYLEAKYGIDPGQIPECRTAYSIKDGKPPRAEFQF